MRTYGAEIRWFGASGGETKRIEASNLRIALGRVLLPEGWTHSTGQITDDLRVHESLTIRIERLR